MIRNATIPISYTLLAQARLYAQAKGIDSAETVVELALRTLLDASPEIARWHQLREAAKKAADAQWRDERSSRAGSPTAEVSDAAPSNSEL